MDAGVAAKTPTLTPEARSSIDREVISAKVALTSVAHKRAVVAELEVALKDVKVPMTTKVDGKNATAQFEESGAKMVAQLKRDKDAYKALADCLGSK
jgi:DNA-binding transcriptional regulator GbsR (MarR family)